VTRGLVILLMLLTSAWAQERPKFWTYETVVTVASITAATGVDAWATNNGFEHVRNWQEHNPLIPRAEAGRAAYFAGTYAAGIAGAWLLNRTGHPRLAKWVLRVQFGIETQAAIYTGVHQ
jgi:hypothetical protein